MKEVLGSQVVLLLAERILITKFDLCRIELLVVQRSKRPNKLASRADLNIRCTET